MENKELKESAIDIKGHLYVPVSARIVYFNNKYDGSITTEILTPLDSKLIIVKATIHVSNFREDGEEDKIKIDRVFTGHSQAIIGDGYINKSAALENAETSAVGRALAMMGIGVIESVASSDEIFKAENANVNETPKIDYLEKVQEIKKSMEKNVGEPCKQCIDGVYILSPKTGKIFCNKKCWTLEKSDEETKDGYNSHVDLTREQQEAIPF